LPMVGGGHQGRPSGNGDVGDASDAPIRYLQLAGDALLFVAGTMGISRRTTTHLLQTRKQMLLLSIDDELLQQQYHQLLSF
jgi:hypothetical protein